MRRAGVVPILFVPGVLLFLAVGQTTLAGVSFSLVRRLRELVWIGLGFGLLGWYGWRGQGTLDSLEK